MKITRAKKIKRLVGAAVALALIAVFTGANPLWLLEYRAQDAIFQRPGLLHPDIIVIGIDERALCDEEGLGAFPWGREVFAEAINILNSGRDGEGGYVEGARPAVIGVDVLFAGRGRYAWADEALAAAAAAAGNVVAASFFQVGTDRERLRLTAEITGHIRPFPALLPYVEHGSVNGIIDRDGVIRNAALWHYFGGERTWSFPVAVANMYNGVHGGSAEPSRFVRENPSMFIRYSDKPGYFGGYKEFSFADIFEPWFNAAWLAGQIILIGPYAVGMMDHHAVPLYFEGATDMYGVDIHANVVQQLLDGAYKQRAPVWAAALAVAALIIFGMLLGELIDIRIALCIFIAAGAGYFFLAQYVYRHQGYVMQVLTPLAALGIVFLYCLIYGYILQALEKNRMRSTFKKYVDPKLVDTLIASGEADSDAVGSKKHIAVMFVDVRGFTPMTEGFRDTPELIVETLNEYLELTAGAVFGNGGSVDKFIGDATMALFNGFVPLDDYIYKAVKAADDMVQGAAELNASIKERYGIDIGFGVGIHCGEALVGNLGPSFRKDYTAIGDTVNTAARLESNAKSSQVLISRDVYDMLEGRVIAESIGEIPLKGKTVPLEVMSLSGLT